MSVIQCIELYQGQHRDINRKQVDKRL